MAYYDDSWHDSVLGLSQHTISRQELLAVGVPNFYSPRRAPHRQHADARGDPAAARDAGWRLLRRRVDVRLCLRQGPLYLYQRAAGQQRSGRAVDHGGRQRGGRYPGTARTSRCSATSPMSPPASALPWCPARARRPWRRITCRCSRSGRSRATAAPPGACSSFGAERVATDTSFYNSETAAQAAGMWGPSKGTCPPSPPRTAAHCCASQPELRCVVQLVRPGAAEVRCRCAACHLGRVRGTSAVVQRDAGTDGRRGRGRRIVLRSSPPACRRRRCSGNVACRPVPRKRRRRNCGHLQPRVDHPRPGRHTVRAVATNASGSVSSALATLNVVDQASPPAITAISGPLTVTRTGTAVFAATVKGTEPLSFQWRRDGADILGADIRRFFAWTRSATDEPAASCFAFLGNPAGAVQTVAGN